MRVVTWNVNSLAVRLPRVLQLLAEYRPDVALLQETKCKAEGFPVEELADAGYQVIHHSAGQWAGVAILARSEAELMDECAGLAGEPAAEEARWIEGTIDGVRFASVYVPNGRAVGTPTYAAKLAFLDAMAERVRALAAAGPFVVAGDFNVCPAEADVYDPVAFATSTHVQPEERERFQAILDAGAVDSFRRLHPETVGYTWWDYRQGHFHKGLGLRIDHVLLSEDLAGQLERCGIARDYRKGQKPSDHAPLFAQVGAAPEGPATPDASDSKQI